MSSLLALDVYIGGLNLAVHTAIDGYKFVEPLLTTTASVNSDCSNAKRPQSALRDFS